MGNEHREPRIEYTNVVSRHAAKNEKAEWMWVLKDEEDRPLAWGNRHTDPKEASKEADRAREIMANLPPLLPQHPPTSRENA